MNSFEYKLWRENDLLCFQVLKQPEEIRGTGKLLSCCRCVVSSILQVEICLASMLDGYTRIFVRGRSDKYDNDIAKIKCDEDTEAQIRQSLESFRQRCNEKYPGEQPEKQTQKPKTTIVTVRQGAEKFLFEVPKGYSLKEGDNVMCDTIKGRTPGVCICNSVEADDDSLEAIIALTSAYKPLKKVLGVYQEFEQEIPF